MKYSKYAGANYYTAKDLAKKLKVSNVTIGQTGIFVSKQINGAEKVLCGSNTPYFISKNVLARKLGAKRGIVIGRYAVFMNKR